MRYLPGILGALCIVGGIAWIAPAFGLIAAGVFLLAIDRRIG